MAVTVLALQNEGAAKFLFGIFSSQYAPIAQSLIRWVQNLEPGIEIRAGLGMSYVVHLHQAALVGIVVTVAGGVSFELGRVKGIVAIPASPQLGRVQRDGLEMLLRLSPSRRTLWVVGCLLLSITVAVPPNLNGNLNLLDLAASRPVALFVSSIAAGVVVMTWLSASLALVMQQDRGRR